MGTKATLAAVISLLVGNSSANASAFAETKSSTAKGEKTCLIKQLTSEYLEKEAAEAKARAGISFYVKTSSYLTFKVQKSGTAMIAVNEDTFPGSTVYFMIDGKRFSSPSGLYAQLNAPALAALRQDKLIDFTYTGWPDRHEISRKDVFRGFTKAFDDCLTFLGGKPKAQDANAPISLQPKN